MKILLLRSVPIFGWIFLAYGIWLTRSDRLKKYPLIHIAWYIDLFLSLVVHPAQIPIALRNSTNQPALKTALLTFIFGLTWWKTQVNQQSNYEVETIK